MASAVATHYARAFVDLAADPRSSTDPAREVAQLESFGQALRESPPLQTVFATPAVNASRKRAVAGRLCEMMGLSRLVRNFLFVIIDHRRTGDVGEIVKAVREQLDARLGVIRAAVTSAAELDSLQRTALQHELSRLTGQQVRAEFAVDPTLIGGVVARIGSTMYDGSVRGQLDGLRRQLVGNE